MQLKLNSERERGDPSEVSHRSTSFPPKEYEEQLQKYEGEVRNHIKIEQQLKLHIDGLNEKIEELETTVKRAAKDAKKKEEELKKQLENKDASLGILEERIALLSSEAKQLRDQRKAARSKSPEALNLL